MTSFWESRGTQISKDARGRALDNIFTERLWRSVKWEEVYLTEYATVLEARTGIGNSMKFYNSERKHQPLNYKTPAEIYFGKEEN
jgi:putative transposase